MVLTAIFVQLTERMAGRARTSFRPTQSENYSWFLRIRNASYFSSLPSDWVGETAIILRYVSCLCIVKIKYMLYKIQKYNCATILWKMIGWKNRYGLSAWLRDGEREYSKHENSVGINNLFSFEFDKFIFSLQSLWGD